MKLLYKLFPQKRRKIKGDIIKADHEVLKEIYPNASWSYPDNYQGEEIRCSQCGKRFIFSAKDKQFYYESKGGNIYAKIHMCKPCYAVNQSNV